MILNVCASAVIPAVTLWLFRGYGWFTANFSVIGNMFRRKEVFVLWAAVVGIYFFFSLRQLIGKMPGKVRGSFLVPLAVVLLFLGVTTPYLPQEFPLKAAVHIVLAMAASACLVTFLGLFFRQMKAYMPERAGRCLWGLGIIVAGSGILFLAAGIISSAMEIFFVLGMVALTERVRRYQDWEKQIWKSSGGNA